jgi:hypothetical protein
MGVVKLPVVEQPAWFELVVVVLSLIASLRTFMRHGKTWLGRDPVKTSSAGRVSPPD